MRACPRWLLSLGAAMAVVSVGLPDTASAQPDVRDHRNRAGAPSAPPAPRDRRTPPRPADRGPTAAPPAAKPETPGTRAGYVWVAGHWEWKANDWQWVAGHWERERKGKQWRPARWDQKGGQWTFVAGGWIDAPAAPPAAPPGPPAAGPGDHPREAPPSPREEKIAARAGYVWIPGRWDWKDRKWQWVDGHWERERKGQQWRQGRWEQKGDRWAYVGGAWEDARGPVAADRPRQPPPSPRPEKITARAGHVWIAGHWDWRGGKWEWVDGHWERERAGQQWRPVRWEQRDGFYTRVDGGWIDAGPPGRPGRPATPPRASLRDRPHVVHYGPTKGKAGTKIVIRGKNFPKTTTVLWGGTPIQGAKVGPLTIQFQAPKNAQTGLITLRTGKGRDLLVGNFEVAAAYDPVAEQKRLEEEARKKAEAAWAERQKQLAKDRAAREAALKQLWDERAATREQRRTERAAQIRAQWERAFLADDETQDELALHAQRLAELVRMSDLASLTANSSLAIRIELLRARENERHTSRMAALEAAFRAGGNR